MDKNTSTSEVLADPIINCSLQIALSPEDTVVHVRRGSVQCFNFTALKCCCNSNITINAINDAGGILPNPIVRTNFGSFNTNISGICFTPDVNLGNPQFPNSTSTSLLFRATSTTADGCVNTVDLLVNFVFAPCEDCCKCRKC